MDEALSLTEPREVGAKIRAIESRLYEAHATVPLWWKQKTVALSPRFRNVELDHRGLLHGFSLWRPEPPQPDGGKAR